MLDIKPYEPVEFTVKDAKVIIDYSGNQIFILKKSKIFNEKGELIQLDVNKKVEIKNGLQIEISDIDKQIVGESRYLNDILDDWVDSKNRTLGDYLKAIGEVKVDTEVGKDNVQGTTEGGSQVEQSQLSNAFEIILKEFGKPKDLNIRHLESIDKKLGELLEGNKSREVVEEYNNHNWNVPDNGVNISFSKTVYGYKESRLISKLETKKAMLLIGVPGTGKTKIMMALINKLTGGDRSRYKVISFGQNTDYIDFIGGITSVNGEWKYRDGVLTDICKEADKDRDNNYYLGIDELSRGNTEAILGELMTGIEHRDQIITLKNKMTLVIPSNLYIIGTMNTLDNSTKKLDNATMERFTRETILPKWDTGYIDWICEGIGCEDTKNILYETAKIMRETNNLIAKDELLGADKMIGVRAISNIEITREKVLDSIAQQLIPDIKSRVKFGKESEGYRALIEELEVVLTDGRA